MPFPNLYDLHAQVLCVDQFRDSNPDHPYYAYVVCSNCQSSDLDVNCYPYYVISDKGFVRSNSMIEVMNE